MSGVLGRVYAFFLQQATAMARLAEAQLAFERQELPSGFIGTDYWRDATAAATAPDRRGLTGSARLLEDVHRLDQFAFETDRRKLHLSQTFPLSQLGAFELQQFRETGVLTFATQQALFDSEFPGHYLRLIKRVKVSVIALLPPGRGVRATLAASGLSRVVVARGPFDTVSLHRQPESIAFTSPSNATGMFDLEPEGGLLLPFEGMGVDSVWRLELPKPANPFDYRTIADVLLTIEYTALASEDYRDRIVRELDRRFTGDRAFSIRNQFPDAWYDLNNPGTVDPERRMRALLTLKPDDLPTHIGELRVEQLTVFVLRRDELADELTFTSAGHTAGGQSVTAGEVTTTGGIVSTRRPGGTPWGVLLGGEPTGEWELAIEDNTIVRSWFTDELIDDIVDVMSLSGTTPEWP
jgi:Tc toxin complex TcA C-terminal TcB-binding domain